jgi:hypothetical protein
VVRTIYEPRQYFGRVRRVARALDGTRRRYRPPLRRWAKELKGFVRMAKRLGFRADTGREFWTTFLDTLFRNPRAIRYTGALCGLYLHFGPFSQYVANRLQEAVEREQRSPSRVAPAPPPKAKREHAAAATAATGQLESA